MTTRTHAHDGLFLGPLTLAQDARVQHAARAAMEGAEGPCTLEMWRRAERDVRRTLAREERSTADNPGGVAAP